MLLKCSKTMFWRCLNRSGKSSSTTGLRRILWKTVKPFLLINIHIFTFRPEIYRAMLVYENMKSSIQLKSINWTTKSVAMAAMLKWVLTTTTRMHRSESKVIIGCQKSLVAFLLNFQLFIKLVTIMRFKSNMCRFVRWRVPNEMPTS